MTRYIFVDKQVVFLWVDKLTQDRAEINKGGLQPGEPESKLNFFLEYFNCN